MTRIVASPGPIWLHHVMRSVCPGQCTEILNHAGFTAAAAVVLTASAAGCVAGVMRKPSCYEAGCSLLVGGFFVPPSASCHCTIAPNATIARSVVACAHVCDGTIVIHCGRPFSMAIKPAPTSTDVPNALYSRAAPKRGQISDAKRPLSMARLVANGRIC